MATEDLEGKVKDRTNYRGIAGRAVRTVVFGAAIGAAALFYGRFREAKDGKLSTWQHRKQIKELAVEGYAWKEESDPTYYLYRPVLISNPEAMTMQGYIIKVTETDTVDGGPIRKDGNVGYSVYEELKRGVQEDAKTFKEKAKDFYERADSTIRQKYRQVFKKDTTAGETR